jgi:hypothetical protein
MVGPSVPSFRVQLMRYPWYQISSAALSAWQASFGLKNANLPLSGEVAECSVLTEIIGRVLDNLAECHQVNYDGDRCTY